MSVLQIDKIRRQLREKFPAAHRDPIPEESSSQATSLEFSAGHLSEIISPHESAGASLIICELLDQKRDLPIALVDSRDTFDPASYGNDNCRHLIWLRCSKTEQALKCTDLLLSDGNLPLILLDLHLVSERELRQIPPPSGIGSKSRPAIRELLSSPSLRAPSYPLPIVVSPSEDVSPSIISNSLSPASSSTNPKAAKSPGRLKHMNYAALHFRDLALSSLLARDGTPPDQPAALLSSGERERSHLIAVNQAAR